MLVRTCRGLHYPLPMFINLFSWSWSSLLVSHAIGFIFWYACSWIWSELFFCRKKLSSEVMNIGKRFHAPLSKAIKRSLSGCSQSGKQRLIDNSEWLRDTVKLRNWHEFRFFCQYFQTLNRRRYFASISKRRFERKLREEGEFLAFHGSGRGRGLSVAEYAREQSLSHRNYYSETFWFSFRGIDSRETQL